MAKSNSKLKLKLQIDSNSNRVLFAESSKEFVDFLFSLLSLPLGTVVKLLKDGGMADLFGSIVSLDETYLQSSKNVKSVLNPTPPSIAFKSPLLLTDGESKNRSAYMCRTPNPAISFGAPSATIHHYYVSDSPNTPCPSCRNPMNHKLQVVDSESPNQQGDSSSSGAGFVKGVVTYVVLDNLEVKPLSTISSVALIKSFNIRDVDSLEEMVVEVGYAEALKLLRASLQSKNVLTSVFLNKN